MKPIYRKEVYPDFVKYYLGCRAGNIGFEGGLLVTVTELEQGHWVRSEVARVLLELRGDLRMRLRNSRSVG